VPRQKPMSGAIELREASKTEAADTSGKSNVPRSGVKQARARTIRSPSANSREDEGVISSSGAKNGVGVKNLKQL